MEIKLQQNDTIISKTDTSGKITYVNKGFVTISEFDEVQLIGQPHNILRHQAMPKAIFSYLWSTITAGDAMFAYVVNKTAQDNYYWVLAHITPITDDTGEICAYQSLRRKANPLALEIIKPIYQKMLDIEKSEDVEASLAYLSELLESENSDYNSFINMLQTQR